jgi:hypothetical protein
MTRPGGQSGIVQVLLAVVVNERAIDGGRR